MPAGTASMPEIEHIVVLMMENHSFDNLLGHGPPPGARARRPVDGLTLHRGQPVNSNPDATGSLDRRPARQLARASSSGEPSQAWNASHQS